MTSVFNGRAFEWLTFELHLPEEEGFVSPGTEDASTAVALRSMRAPSGALA